jgi:hypothetical protein
MPINSVKRLLGGGDAQWKGALEVPVQCYQNVPIGMLFWR